MADSNLLILFKSCSSLPCVPALLGSEEVDKRLLRTGVYTCRISIQVLSAAWSGFVASDLPSATELARLNWAVWVAFPTVRMRGRIC